MFERFSERARHVLFMGVWSARRRGGPYVEPEDLLHALIREDRGELPALISEVFPGARPTTGFAEEKHPPFFSDELARTLLREIHEDPEPVNIQTPDETRESVRPVDLPLSRSLKRVLALAAEAHQHDTKMIGPLHLLLGILDNPDSRLAEVLLDSGVTRQSIADALDFGS